MDIRSYGFTSVVQFDTATEQYVAWFQRLPGCIAYGSTDMEALAGLEDLRVPYLKARLARNAPVPSPDFDIADLEVEEEIVWNPPLEYSA